MRFTIKLKLASAFAAIILLSGVAAWVGTNSLATIDENLKALLAGPVARLEKIENIQITFLNMLRFDKNVLLVSEAHEIKGAEEASHRQRQELLKELEEFSRNVSAVNRQQFDALRQLVSQYLPLQDKMFQYAQRNSNAEAAELAEKEGHTDEFMTMLLPLRDRLATVSQPSPETVSASTALGDVLLLLRDLETVSAIRHGDDRGGDRRIQSENQGCDFGHRQASRNAPAFARHAGSRPRRAIFRAFRKVGAG